MKCSNVFSQIRLVVVSVMLASSLTACMKPSERSADPNADFTNEKAQAAATFSNSEIGGSAAVSKNLEGFSIPTEKLINFWTVVIDKRTQEPIKGHKFSITGAPGAVVVGNNGRSDDKGMVYWSETLPYNGAADAKYLPIKRMIVANGMHTGARELQICINPWVDGTEAVKDCGKKSVPESQIAKVEEIPYLLKGESKLGEKIDRHLWVNDMRIMATHNPGAAIPGMIDFSVMMTPKILRMDVKGEEDTTALKDGVFAVQFWVVAKTGDSSNACEIIAKSDPSREFKMVGGQLQEEQRMQLRYIGTYGQLELVGVISPRANAANLTPFNGVWTIGDHTALLGMKFGFPRTLTYRGEIGSFDAKKYVASCRDVAGGQILEKAPSRPTLPLPLTTALAAGSAASTAVVNGKTVVAPDLMTNDCVDAPDIARLFPDDSIAKDFRGGADLLSCINKNLPSGITRLEQFEFGLVEVKPEPIVDPLSTETTTERTIKYSVTTRVTNPLAQGAALRDIEFTVEKSDGSVDEIRTNHNGDLIFTDKVHHVYFAPERYMLKIVRIRQKSGFTKRLAIVFNPWDNNGFTFARDMRKLTKQTIAQVNLVPRPKSELLLTQFQWGTQGFRYEVDDFLNLKMFKQFNLTLSPRVLRYSSLTEGRMKNEPLRDGIYLMKVAIQKDYRPIDGDPLEYVTSVRKLVRVVAGQIITPVEMAFRDFRILKLRTNLMIEITTIDEAKLSPSQRKTLIIDGALESLIDSSSGLPSRTFIGPVVAYSNGFSSSMRPADDLSESYCKTIDCDELKRNDKIPPSELAEEAKFFGSLRHLANKSVGDMILRQGKIDKAYQNQMVSNARLAQYLEETNMDYGAVANEAKIVKQDPKLVTNNHFLRAGSGFDDFVKRLGQIDPKDSFTGSSTSMANMYRGMVAGKKFDASTVRDVFFNGKPFDYDLAARLCVFFDEGVVLQRTAKDEASLGFLDRSAATSRRQVLNENCVRALRFNDGNMDEPVFSLERKMRIFRLADSERRGGNLMNLSVGAGSSYGLGKSQSFSYGWSATGMLTGTLKALGFGVAEKIIDAFGVSMSVSRSESKSMGEDTGVNVGQSLAVELRGMRLTLGEYERCASIKFSQSYLESQFKYLLQAMPNNISAKEKLDRMQRGIFLCEGTVLRTPLQVDERYYQFSQMLGDELMNDPTAFENHPYMQMTLRSRPDFARMIRMLEARPQSLSDIPGHFNIGEVPMERLMKVFKSSLPSFPGVITLEPDSIVKAPVVHKIQPK